MEAVIILLLLASFLTVWILSVRRGLEAQEINIHNAMTQIRVHLQAEQEALLSLLELLKNSIDPGMYREMRQQLAMSRDDKEELRPEKAAEQQKNLLQMQEKISGISEQMPLLQAQETYQKYWKAAKSYENMVKTSELIYNDSVERFNRMLSKMPDRLAAGICGFHPKKCMEII